jgi:hypothetical protein
LPATSRRVKWCRPLNALAIVVGAHSKNGVHGVGGTNLHLMDRPIAQIL